MQSKFHRYECTTIQWSHSTTGKRYNPIDILYGQAKLGSTPVVPLDDNSPGVEDRPPKKRVRALAVPKEGSPLLRSRMGLRREGIFISSGRCSHPSSISDRSDTVPVKLQKTSPASISYNNAMSRTQRWTECSHRPWASVEPEDFRWPRRFSTSLGIRVRFLNPARRAKECGYKVPLHIVIHVHTTPVFPILTTGNTFLVLVTFFRTPGRLCRYAVGIVVALLSSVVNLRILIV